MNLALFDLDNTLLSCDSDFEWAQFLIEKGAIDMIVRRPEMRLKLASVLAKLTNQPAPNPEAPREPIVVPAAPEEGHEA